MNVMTVANNLGGLSSLKFFPSDKFARTSILRLVCSMASNEQQVEWLVARMTSGIFNEWPGPRELRACFCGKHRPADGINAYSDIYPDGLPSESPQRELQAVPMLALPPGHVASVDPELERSILELARAKDMKNVGRRLPVGDISVVQITDANRIKQTDVEKEVEKLHDQRAREEVGL